MDKRKESNNRVKRAITKAFFRIFPRKKIRDITVTELVNEAGVARASFYRNYDSKEDVMMAMLHDILIDFKNTADYDLSNPNKRKHVIRAFEYFERYGIYLKDMYNSGYALMILDEINRFHEEIAGGMPAGSLERFKLYVYTGALFNTAMTWINEGKGEKAEDVAAVFCKEFGIE